MQGQHDFGFFGELKQCVEDSIESFGLVCVVVTMDSGQDEWLVGYA